jgi:hypothetical protein
MRALDESLRLHLKTKGPSLSTYDSFSYFGQKELQGGAPNNFLLMKNERKPVPF